jgi:hypothetical protein
MTAGTPKYPVSEETIVQEYCIGCRLRQGGYRDRREAEDCLDCYITLREGMMPVDTLERYKIR